MIHVVFNEPDVEILKKAIELDETLTGDVLLIRDDYAVGPLTGIFLPEGQEKRKDWWRTVLQGSDNENSVDDGTVNDPAVLINIKEQLINNSEEEIWIWAAQNKHDVCGYYWLVSQLAGFQGRIHLLYLNNLPFINEKGSIFYPDWLSQIQPKEFLKAKKLARPITTSEFEVDGDEWNKICEDDKMIRLLEGGKKIVQKEVNYYDTELLKFVTNDFQKANKVVNAFLNKGKETTGDAFVFWRLKELTKTNQLDVQGELKGMKDFEIKKKSVSEAGA
jgi:hypothetical protein